MMIYTYTTSNMGLLKGRSTISQLLTSSHRMPFKPTIFAGSRVNTPQHVAVTCVGWRVYTQVFLGIRGDMVRWPRTKGTAVHDLFLWRTSQEFVNVSSVCCLVVRKKDDRNKKN